MEDLSLEFCTYNEDPIHKEDLSLEFCAQIWAHFINKILALISGITVILGINLKALNIAHLSLIVSVEHNNKKKT